ncbi:hypothetical protein J6590_030828 [Homalodisca vitripennis]|nr:hypothetical protein J6590_030828 [Homalodisca vitripennis]
MSGGGILTAVFHSYLETSRLHRQLITLPAGMSVFTAVRLLQDKIRNRWVKQRLKVVNFHFFLPFNKQPPVIVDNTRQQKKKPLTEEVVIRIAQAHGKSPGQVLLRHMVQLGVAVILQSSHPDRIKQNIDVSPKS